MGIDDLLWELVLVGMTVACRMMLIGVREAKRYDVTTHRKWMTIACSLVGIWLVAYDGKQLVFGRDHFGFPQKTIGYSTPRYCLCIRAWR